MQETLPTLPEIWLVAESVSNVALTEQTALTLFILAGAAFVQATVGFAAALFGLPFLLWVGNDLMTSQVLLITAMLPQNVFAVWKLRKSFELKEVLVPAAIRISALPLGIAGLAIVMSWTSTGVNQLVGAITLFAVVIQALVGIEWKSAKRWYWVVATFGGSGFLQGLSGMSGPPMVLWVHGQRYSANHARAFLFAMYISNFIPQVLLLWWRFGQAVWNAVGIAMLSLPLVLVGAMLGLRLGSWFGDRWLRPISYACLVCLACSSLLDPWLKAYVYPILATLVSKSN